MQGHREKGKKVLTPSGIPSSAKSRDLSIPPGLDLHTPVGPELAETLIGCVRRGRLAHLFTGPCVAIIAWQLRLRDHHALSPPGGGEGGGGYQMIGDRADDG